MQTFSTISSMIEIYNDDIELGRREDHVKKHARGVAAYSSGVWRCVALSAKRKKQQKTVPHVFQSYTREQSGGNAKKRTILAENANVSPNKYLRITLHISCSSW